MVRFIAYTAVLAFAAVSFVRALPELGTYLIQRDEEFLTLKEKTGNVFHTAPAKDLGTQQWVLESGSVFGTFTLKNSKFGSYIGFNHEGAGSWVIGKDTPSEFLLFQGNKPDTYRISIKDVMGQELGLGGTVSLFINDYQKAALQFQDNNSKGWTFVRQATADDKPQVLSCRSD
ncbi:hypothetical protein FRC07_014458 [Ceratobasidium sp. 392]|nr:hypothetical protein FRC07_014458 [Ceratobasidium sp. 392]